jgi:hypothetical protein
MAPARPRSHRREGAKEERGARRMCCVLVTSLPHLSEPVCSLGGRNSRSSNPISHFQVVRQARKGKMTCLGAHSKLWGCWKYTLACLLLSWPLLCFPPLSSHSHPPPAPPPYIHTYTLLGLLQVFHFLSHPAPSPAQACLSPHLSPHLLSHCCMAFFSQPLEPGESLHTLFGQCFPLSPCPSQLLLG